MRFSDGAAGGMLESLNARIPVGSKLRGWTAPRPATLDGVRTAVKLFEFSLPDPALVAPAAARSIAFAAMEPIPALETGQLDHITVDAPGEVPVLDALATSLILPPTSDGHVSKGTSVDCTGLAITLPQGA